MDKTPWDTGIARVLLEMKTDIIDHKVTMTEELCDFRESLIEAFQSAIAHKFRSGDLDSCLLDMLRDQELSFQVGTMVTSTVTTTAVEALITRLDQFRTSAGSSSSGSELQQEETRHAPKLGKDNAIAVERPTAKLAIAAVSTVASSSQPEEREEQEAALNNLQDPPLARKLLEWALSENTDMKQSWKNDEGLKQMSYTRNKTVNEIVALCCVHQYASGCMGSTPPKQNGCLDSLETTDPAAYSRGVEMAGFLDKYHRNHFSGPRLIKEKLLRADLYSKLEHYKRRIKSHGLFDPEAREYCFDSKQTSGGYWKQYRKLNRAVDGIHDKAKMYKESNELYMSPESVREFEANEGLLYIPAVKKRVMVSNRNVVSKRKRKAAPTPPKKQRRNAC